MTKYVSGEEGVLAVIRCWCGIQFAIPGVLDALRHRQHDNGLQVQVVFCPMGHQLVPSGEQEIDRVRRALARERARHEATRKERDRAEAQRRAEKAAKTKLKKRVGAGVCPCCKRSFQNLGRHMKGQHPEFSAS